MSNHPKPAPPKAEVQLDLGEEDTCLLYTSDAADE